MGHDIDADDPLRERPQPTGSRAGAAGYVVALVCSAAALAVLDRSDSDAANQAALLLILVLAGALGALRPQLAWLSALVIGSTIAVARAIALLLGRSPADPQAPHTLPAVATLLVLVVPAAAASYAGACARRAIAPPSSTPEPPAQR